MIPNATNKTVRSILNRSIKKDKLNILTLCAHERYEQALCKTGHNFYSLAHYKKWDKDYGEIPENYININTIPEYLDFDLILAHTDDFPILDGVPVIRHVHVLPDIRYDIEQEKNRLKFIAKHTTTMSFISDFSRKEWGFSPADASVIEHGIDTNFWKSENIQRKNLCLSVVNEWPNRDWCCGWELWKSIVGFDNTSFTIPVRVVGKNKGLSEPAKSIIDLKNIYNTSSIFLNTSLHSPVPTVLLEAMSCGCAVVSTATCMIPEIIKHGENGFISNDPNELKSYINLLLSNENIARKMGDEARKTIETKFNITNFINNWNKLFYSTIEV